MRRVTPPGAGSLDTGVCVWRVRGAVIRDSGPSAFLSQKLRRLLGTDLRIFLFGGITTPSPRKLVSLLPR